MRGKGRGTGGPEIDGLDTEEDPGVPESEQVEGETEERGILGQ